MISSGFDDSRCLFLAVGSVAAVANVADTGVAVWSGSLPSVGVDMAIAQLRDCCVAHCASVILGP